MVVSSSLHHLKLNNSQGPEKYKFSPSITLTLKSVNPSLCPRIRWILEVFVELKYVAVHNSLNLKKILKVNTRGTVLCVTHIDKLICISDDVLLQNIVRAIKIWW